MIYQLRLTLFLTLVYLWSPMTFGGQRFIATSTQVDSETLIESEIQEVFDRKNNEGTLKSSVKLKWTSVEDAQLYEVKISIQKKPSF